MCMAANDCKLTERMDAVEGRVGSLEASFDKLRNESHTGFNMTNSNIETLSQQITNMDKRIIEEKVKWGDVFRNIVKWTVRTGLAIVAYAAGVNLTKTIIGMWQ